MSVLFYNDPISLEHDNGPGHPEAPVRIKAITDLLDKENPSWLLRRGMPEATRQQLEWTHPKPYVDRVLASVPERGYFFVDGDTSMCPATGRAALKSAGAAAAAVDAVVQGESLRAFTAMRPPGHHAELDKTMGFCFFNNVAVAAMEARNRHGIGKIAIFDFDVHHGNGTQNIFWDDPETLFVSVHQSPLYPGTGDRLEAGTRNNVLNRPCPPGTTPDLWRKLVEREVLPRIDQFQPKLILLSAGFDAHKADPLAHVELEEDDYRWVAERMVELAEKHADGKVVATLEGGYNPGALAASVRAFLEGLRTRAA